VTGRLLTAREVGELVGLSTESVLRRWRAGEIPGFRIASNVLRFDPGDRGCPAVSHALDRGCPAHRPKPRKGLGLLGGRRRADTGLDVAEPSECRGRAGNGHRGELHGTAAFVVSNMRSQR
jgi:hypothetical protein